MGFFEDIFNTSRSIIQKGKDIFSNEEVFVNPNAKRNQSLLPIVEPQERIDFKMKIPEQKFPDPFSSFGSKTSTPQTGKGVDIKRRVVFPLTGGQSLLPPKKDFSGQSISQGEISTIDSIIAKLPGQAREIVTQGKDVISEGLFGNVKDKTQLYTLQREGKSPGLFTELRTEGFLPFLGRDKTEQVQRLSDSLKDKGIEPERASSLAFYSIMSRGGSFLDREAQDQAKEQLALLEPTRDEKNTLLAQRVGQVAGSALDAAGVVPIGSVSRVSKFDNLLAANKARISVKNGKNIIQVKTTERGIDSWRTVPDQDSALKFFETAPKKPRKVDMSTTPELDEKLTQAELRVESLKDNPLNALVKYSGKEGLPEVTGKHTGKFAREGDQIVTEVGFDNSEDARKAFDSFFKEKKAAQEDLSSLKKEAQIFRAGRATERANIKIATSLLAERRRNFRALTDRYQLTPKETQTILAKYSRTGNIAGLTENQFKAFMKEADDFGEKLFQTQKQRSLLKANIEQRGLVNTKAAREALKLPKIHKMNTDQIQKFDQFLSKFEDGDEFLGKRLQETIDRTRLKGVRTYRQAKQVLAKNLNTSLDDIKDLAPGELDRFRYDEALARQNPFYDLIVNETTKAMTVGSMRYTKFSDEIDKLVTAARKSRKRSVGDIIAPTDDNIFDWLSAAPDVKDQLAKTMTKEELRAAEFLRDRFARARDYLLKEEMMSRFVPDYITNIRRSGLEAWRKDGFVAGMREMFEQYRVDQEMFDIMNRKTGEILPMEKFFQFAMKRSGTLTPSKNVSRAANAYFSAFEKKKALDQVVPELEAYMRVLSPRNATKTGLETDPRLGVFLKEYIQNKRGRPISNLVEPGSAKDVVIHSLMGFTRAIHLGFSLPNFVAANVGEQASSIIQAGFKQHAKGTIRMNTAQGKKIIEKYRGFVGRNPFKEMVDSSKNLPDKFFSSTLVGFSDATVRANKQALLGALTDAEFKSGIVSKARLTEIRRNVARWRALPDTSSLQGSTSVGKMMTQYKAWAVPILSSTADNLKVVLKQAKAGKNPLLTREGRELIREAVLIAPVAIYVTAYMDDDDSFLGQVTQKSARDALSAVGAVDPRLWVQTPVVLDFLQGLVDSLETLVTLEKYKTGDNAGELKGPSEVLKQIEPAPIRQIRKTINEPRVSSDVKKASDAEDEEREQDTLKAKEVFEEYQKIQKSGGDGQAYIKEVHTSGEISDTVFEKVKNLKEKEDLNWTDDEREIRNLGVQNWKRAEVVFGRLQEMKEKGEDTQAYIQDLHKRKIISDNVLDQVKAKKVYEEFQNRGSEGQRYIIDLHTRGVISDKVLNYLRELRENDTITP